LKYNEAGSRKKLFRFGRYSRLPPGMGYFLLRSSLQASREGEPVAQQNAPPA
jgi:hypothetical protein